MAVKAVFVIAHKNFRDEEYFEPKRILERAGFETKTASTLLTPATGKLGGSAAVDLLFTEIDANKFDILIFVGGPGVVAFWDDWRTQSLAKLFVENNKPVAAICSAPVILARAGLLAGKRATSFPGDDEKMKAGGCIYTDAEVEIDGLFITANGPAAAKAFGAAIISYMVKR